MKRNLLTTLACLLCFLLSSAQLKLSPDRHFLRTTDDKPFFWLGDTGWDLFQILKREDVDWYLEDRAKKGFTIIEAVVLAERDGLGPNIYGHRPLLNDNPATPNEAFFQDVDYIVNKAEQLGLIIGMLPTWGNFWHSFEGTTGIFTNQSARSYGRYLGNRYKDKPIVWILGGDRVPTYDVQYGIINSLAQGLREGDEGRHLITFHPDVNLASDFFRGDDWLDIDMAQTGHSSLSLNYQTAQRSRESVPVRPYIDGESRYEDHPDRFDPNNGWLDDFDVRQTAYWSMLSGAAGHTYGNHNVWQFNGSGSRGPFTYARNFWKDALNQPGAVQMGIMKKFFESHSWQDLAPDQSLIAGDNPETEEHIAAAISQNKDLLMAYTPYGRTIKVNTGKINKSSFCAYWFNPRDGKLNSIGSFQKKETQEFIAPSEGRGNDWLLVIDANCNNESVEPTPPPTPVEPTPKPEEPKLSVSVSPNPSAGDFKVVVTSNSNLPINLYLYNQSGKLVGSLINYDRTVPLTIPGSYLEKGNYFGVAIQGNMKISVTLVKF